MGQDVDDDILKEFVENLINNQEDVPEDIQKFIDENFWDLLETTNDE